MQGHVVVTGGAGYIGSHLVDALLARGREVVVIDDLSSGSISNIAHNLGSENFHFVKASVLDETVVRQFVEGASVVFHLAAAVGVRTIVEQPLQSLLVNVEGTRAVLEAAMRSGAKVVLASTSEVYGKSEKVPFSETSDRVLGPTTVHRWGYSTAKALDEHLAYAYAEEGLSVCILRYFNSYGPRLDPRGYGSVVATFIRQSLAGEPLTVHGDGSQTRCFTYIDDTVEGTLRAADANIEGADVFNLGSTDEISIYRLAEKIRTMLRSDSEIRLVPYEEYYGKGFEDTPRRVPDISRASSVLGWSPTVSLDEGLRRTIDWWQRVHGSASDSPKASKG
jgi:UDP-glucose 4-epimerase